jgi:DNA invertase Pin-like site-specific DNA recombinase
MKTADKPRTAASVPVPRPKIVPLAMSSSSKIEATHLDRLAIVYVRQSSPRQVMENRESTERQYGFAEQAVAFGWPRDRVVTIDEDLGKSGRTTDGRDGFQHLVSEVTLNHVGMVLGLEMSRLARSSKDWHAFFEMCAIFGTLIVDEDGVYDGNDPNDRLLLGLKRPRS